MIKTNSILLEIKKTKSVLMAGNQEGVEVQIYDGLKEGMPINYSPGQSAWNLGSRIYIPMSKIFQVQRGLTSYIQRFHRRKDK